MDYDFDRSVPGGGSTRAGGGFYHLSFRSGSRASGACASGAFDYATREGEYGYRDLDEALHIESDHMPSWARDEPEAYWDAADLYERANGRLYVTADFALPRDLALEDQVDLAREFAQHLTEDEQLPYTLAIHAGRDANGHEHNPHAHLIFSERHNDGIERSRDQWFRRADSEHPERGGAPKSRTFHGPEWIKQARERWADLTNKTLERCGRPERVDHRSYERQGVDREPGKHYGPSAAHMTGRGEDHDRLESASSALDAEQAIRVIDSQIARLEAAREAMLGDELPGEQRSREPRYYSHSHSSGRTDGGSWER